MKLLLALLAIPLTANAWQFEAGAGATKYTDRGDGIWIQYSQPYSEHLKAPVLTAGVTGPLMSRGNWGIDWHADYVYMGGASASCWCSPADANYDADKHAMRNPLPVPIPNVDFEGSGHLNGLALTLEPYYFYRGMRFGIEAGLFPNMPEWRENVHNVVFLPGLAPREVNLDAGRHVSIGAVVGASIGYRNFTLAYQHYFLPTQHTSSPPIWSAADVLLLKYRF